MGVTTDDPYGDGDRAQPATPGSYGIPPAGFRLPADARPGPVSDRRSLGRFVRHRSEVGERAGAGDHLVSEAFYLTDPDGLGIEVYADRPRETWIRLGRELMMVTDPVDVRGLVRDAGGPRGSRRLRDLVVGRRFAGGAGSVGHAAGGPCLRRRMREWVGRAARRQGRLSQPAISWSSDSPGDLGAIIGSERARSSAG